MGHPSPFLPPRLPVLGVPLPTVPPCPPIHHVCLMQVYAVYGGFFIILSYLWGWAVDGTRPDTGDWVGSAIAVAGACVAFFWPGR